MTLEINSIYDSFSDWESFQTIDDDMKDWQSKAADLKIGKSTGLSIDSIPAEAAIFSWSLYELSKLCIKQISLWLLYPAQLASKLQLDQWRKQILIERNQNQTISRHARLEKNGASYSALLIGRRENLSNGRWVLHANGNRASFEKECLHNPDYLDPYLDAGYNVLLVNGPGVGRSCYMSSLDQLGEAQDLGLHLLESALKAHTIVMTGFSIGAAAQSLAIHQHTFLTGQCEYIVVRLATFSRLSDLIQKLLGPFGKSVLAWIGCEIDSVAASQKLESLGIHEIIFQNECDWLIRGVELSSAFAKDSTTKSIHTIPDQGHYYIAHREVLSELEKWEKFSNSLALVEICQ
jgi:hypothetical protein